MDTTEAELMIDVDLVQEASEVSSYDQGWWAGYNAARMEYEGKLDTELRYLERRVSLLQGEIRYIANRDDDGEDRQCSR